MGTASDQPSPRPAILDTEQLDQLRELPGSGGGTLLDELVEIVARDVPPDLARLEILLRQRAAAELAQLAHRVAGSAASLGAVSLRQVLHELEQVGRKGDWAAADRIFSTLGQEWTATCQALRNAARRPAP
jgi:HPt (histidine-containing phosphotransfer) domain-containing protein